MLTFIMSGYIIYSVSVGKKRNKINFAKAGICGGKAINTMFFHAVKNNA